MDITPAEEPMRGGQAVQRPSSFPKQAVVVIHGMGEQMPMDTIKDFVRAAWITDERITANGQPNPNAVWSKPDVRTGSLELRRITTRESIGSVSFPRGIRSDFYELYWADLSGGSTWDQVKDWIGGLLFRDPATQVPRDVLFAWILLWIAALVVVTLAVATVLPKNATLAGVELWKVPPLAWLAGFQGWQLAVATALLGWVVHKFVVPYFGRVVRYTRAKPDNIAARKNVRERGLALLEELHRSRDYDRIILVGHSLGSIVAYDLITYFWARRPEPRTFEVGTKEFDALRELEKAAARLAPDKSPPAEDAASFLEAQNALSRLLRRRPKPKVGEPDRRWLLTDFVTLGSPLSYAELLLAKDAKDLDGRRRAREFPTSPPLWESLDKEEYEKAVKAGLPVDATQRQLMCFPIDDRIWQLHHAAPFAAVRWTNIYDPAHLVFRGDIISGPVAPSFGHGVIDVDLRELRGQSRSFTHTDYWSMPDRPGEPPAHIVQLRKALDLVGDRDL